MDGRALSKYNRISPFKARQVADLIRGQRVDIALQTLALTAKKSSPMFMKTVQSAFANARNKAEGAQLALDESSYIISEVRVDEGPTMKRIRPRAQGRAFRILKRSAHIQVTVSPV
jgi:large subunit ribosomal protein L22